jgi:hypothetical protein
MSSLARWKKLSKYFLSPHTGSNASRPQNALAKRALWALFENAATRQIAPMYV